MEYLRSGIEEAAQQDKAASYGLLVLLVRIKSDAFEIGIVGAVEKDVVDAGHAEGEGNKCYGGNLVL